MPSATALRETEEEVGLARRFVEVIGPVDLYRTGTGFEITPIVGIVTPGFTTQCGSARGRRRVRGAARPLPRRDATTASTAASRQGRERRYYAMPYGERYIWGATAGMLKNLHFVLTAGE